MKKIIYGLMAFSPVLALAQTLDGLTSLAETVKTFLNTLMPVILALAIVYFFWGLAKFVKSAGEQKARDEGKQMMIWGIVAIFIMVSVFGIVNWMAQAAGLDNTLDALPSVQ